MFTGVFYTDVYSKCKEEALANAFALAKIKESCDERAHKYAKKIVLNQPAHYALGAYYADNKEISDIYRIMNHWVQEKK